MKHNRRSIRLKEYDYAASGGYFITICTYEHQCLFGKIVGANSRSPLQGMKPKSISSFIAGYKSVVTKQINQIRNTPRQQVWQRNYYDHIIRNEQDLTRVREYIVNNPLKWEEDIENINYQNQSAGNGRDRSYMQAKNQRPHCESLG